MICLTLAQVVVPSTIPGRLGQAEFYRTPLDRFFRYKALLASVSEVLVDRI